MFHPYEPILEYAPVRFEESGVFADRYQDSYSAQSTAEGFNPIDESKLVFLEGNHLEQRFATRAPKSDFCILETGFGTGLNAMLSADLWFEKTEQGCLHFISTEKHPLHPNDLKRVLQSYRGVDKDAFSERLLTQYPPPHQGFHLLRLYPGRFHLLLLFGDICETLPELSASIDAVFLDGFSPAKNPAMWSTGVLKSIAKLSHSQTSIATFTVAKSVRSALHEVGFHTIKAKGYGKKRHRLEGQFQSTTPESAITTKPGPSSISLAQPETTHPIHIAVLGAGLAGAYTARFLAEQGASVSVYEQGASVAAQASENPALLARPHLSAGFDPLSLLTQCGWLLLNGYLQQQPDSTRRQTQGGLLRWYPKDERLFEKGKRIIQKWMASPWLATLPSSAHSTKESPTQKNDTHKDLKHFESGGYGLREFAVINGPEHIRGLLDHPNIKVLLKHRVEAITITQADQTATTSLPANSIRIQCEPQVSSIYDHCIECFGAGIFDNTSATALHANLFALAGSILQYQEDTAEEYPSPLPWNGWIRGRYILRQSTNDGARIVVGATQHRNAVQVPDQKSDADDLATFFRTAIGQSSFETHAQTRREIGTWAGTRVKSRDHFPCIGPTEGWAHAHRHRDSKLWCNVAHGSKGATTTPAAAAILASAILGGPLPIPKRLLSFYDPTRFKRHSS